MRRGFLLDKPKKRKEPFDGAKPDAPDQTPIAKSDSSEPKAMMNTSLPTDTSPTFWISTPLPYGKVEDTSSPTDFKPNWNITIDAARGTIKSDHKNLVLVTVPPKGSKTAADENDHSEWITLEATKPRVFDAPGFPKPVPKPAGGVPACEVKMTPNMGMGVFATRDIKHTELIFAERPLLVGPLNVNVLQLQVPDTSIHSRRLLLNECEKMLEAAVSRMSPANQAAFKALANSHTEDGSGPLAGINRTNGYGVTEIFDGPGTVAADDSCRYSVVGNIASRINHSCMANVVWNFDVEAFAFVCKAKYDIKAGEQLFYPYCDTDVGVAMRQRKLAPYGIVCECRGCTTATPERDRFREEYEKRTNEYAALNLQVFEKRNLTWPNTKEFQELLKFQETAIQEGLDNTPAYQHLLRSFVLGYLNKGMRGKAEQHLNLMIKNASMLE